MKRVKIKCKICGDVIWSKYYGNYVSCSCKSIAIDQDEFYCRTIGNRENIELEVSNETR